MMRRLEQSTEKLQLTLINNEDYLQRYCQH